MAQSDPSISRKQSLSISSRETAGYMTRGTTFGHDTISQLACSRSADKESRGVRVSNLFVLGAGPALGYAGRVCTLSHLLCAHRRLERCHPPPAQRTKNARTGHRHVEFRESSQGIVGKTLG